MKRLEEKTAVRIVTTGILIIAIVGVFHVYARMNKERIVQQNADYLKNSTIETSGWVEDILENARCSINNTAKLYGKTLTGSEVDPKDLESIADRTVFDYVDFINKDGIDINTQGVEADVSDRSYFIKGMQGESGMDGTYTSAVTGERMVIFYAPVRYQEEIIGVLTGLYREERMKNILDTTMFGEPVPTLLCLADGTIVSSLGIGAVGENALDYMEGRVSQEDLAGIRETLEQEKQFSFSYKADGKTTMAYMASLRGSNWTIIQFFPANALRRMQNAANSAGVMCEAALILLFVGYLLLLMIQEQFQKKKLLRGKEEAERIITGINRLFNRFILVDLEKDTYQYLNHQAPSFQGLAPSGSYSDFIGFVKEQTRCMEDAPPVEEVLKREYIREKLQEDAPFERYEYQVMRDHGEEWENIAVIALEWKEGKPSSVLLAIQEITGQKKQELQTRTALREAYQSAEAANHAKSEFLSRMSHDIRTPMNAIMGMTAIAAMKLDDKDRLQDCLNKITLSSRHLLKLINEVLDMSKIESGKLELMDEEFELSGFVDELLGIFHPQIAGKRQNISVTLGGVVHERVIGDSQHLSQVLVNIMGNAVKFTPEGGHISLHISEAPARVAGNACYEFIITDDGIGMDQEFVEKMFEPFERAGDPRTSKTEGTGLGMAIAKSIVNLMNGDIKVKSKKGEGTQIKVTVFLKYTTDAEEELGLLARYRVMVVDDEKEACENACNILNSINMPSDYFTDGDEAVEALIRDHQDKQEYAAVILDWKMPKKDGIQVAREIRAKVGRDVPIIILSAYDWSAIGQEAIEAGVNEFIAKPLFKSRLVYVMKKVLLGQKDDGKQEEEVLKQEEQFVNKRLLLVEDNAMNMEIAYEILTMSGFSVDKAEDGRAAVDRLLETEPGTYRVVLMDIQMPVMNGYEATRAIRRSGRADLEKLPIIAMTADAFYADIKKAEEAGMNGHIAKPIDINNLMETLKSWI